MKFQYPAFLLALVALASLTAKPVILEVSADKEQQGNPASNAFDIDPKTRWSSQGKGTWIQARLSEPVEAKKVGIGFDRGERDYAFQIQTSMDGKAWSAPASFQSQGKGEKVEEYPLSDSPVRFVRITLFGSNVNDWANVHTVSIPGVKGFEIKNIQEETGGYVVQEWAKHPDLNGAVAISLDDHCRAYIARATRRKQSSLDLRQHQDWVKDDLSFTSVEDRRAYYKSKFNNQGDLNWLQDRNGDGKRDWRDLTVQEDHVRQVSDLDGDGKAETLKTVDSYHTEVTGIAAGVLAVGSSVFACVEPDVWLYQDADNDGFPEKKSLVATGFSLHIGQGGHNMSGLALGPDGRVYWSVADKGHNVVTKEGKKFHMPNAGGIFRCEMDGSRVERFSSGERNAQELAFDANGNLFSMDNDGDYPGEMERAIYITEGSMHGWRINWQWIKKEDFVKISGLAPYNPWMEEQLFLPDDGTRAAYLTPALGNFGPGPCGFAANPGTAMSPELEGRFFMTNNKNEVRVFRFEEKGAFFRFLEESAIPGGISNTGLAIGPDGALYSASWAGGIYRFDVQPDKRHPLRGETKKILASPTDKLDTGTLAKWLGHPDQRVRMKGQFGLVGRGQDGLDALASTFRDGGHLAKLHAVWGIGMVARLQDSQKIQLLEPAWEDSNPEVVAQAAKVTGDLGADHPRFTNELVRCLSHKSPRVQFHAAIALGNQQAAEAVPGLLGLLAGGGSQDAFLRHAAVMGLTGTQTSADLAALAGNPSRAVRLGAIVALRRQQSPAIRAFLDDKDELLLLEAARAIHDDQSIPEALPDLASLLGDNRPDYQTEALMRRSINAALRVNSQSALQLLVDYLKAGKGTEKLRRTALASVLWWAEPPVLDAVEGRYRKHAPRDLSAVDNAVRSLMPVIGKEDALLEVLLNGVNQLGHKEWLPGLADRFDSLPSSLATRYLDALAKADDPRLKSVVEAALQSKSESVRQTALGHAKKAGIPVLDLLSTILDAPGSGGKGKAVTQLAALDEPAAKARFLALVEDYRQGRLDSAIRLEVWRGAKSQGIGLPQDDSLYDGGGDPRNGEQKIVEYQCIQCHQVGKHKPAKTPAGSIGPDLSKIASRRDRAYLTQSILRPNADIAEGYGTAIIQLATGGEITGVLNKKTATTWYLKLPDGKTKEIDSIDISSHTLISVMPDLSQAIQPTDLRDIVAYLSSLK